MPSAVAISLSDWPCAASSRICTCRAVPRRLNTREATGSPGVSPQRSGWRPGLGSGWRPGLGLDSEELGLDSEELGLVGELGLAQGLRPESSVRSRAVRPAPPVAAAAPDLPV